MNRDMLGRFIKGHKLTPKNRRPWTEEERVARSRLFRGSGNPHFKSGKRLCCGYMQVLSENHPARNSAGYVYLHRIIVEGVLGRVLLSSEEVHHLNKNKLDNRLENLLAFDSKSNHRRFENKGEEKGIIFDGRRYSCTKS